MYLQSLENLPWWGIGGIATMAVPKAVLRHPCRRPGGMHGAGGEAIDDASHPSERETRASRR